MLAGHLPNVRICKVLHAPINVFLGADSGYSGAEFGDDVAFSDFNSVDFGKLVVGEALHVFVASEWHGGRASLVELPLWDWNSSCSCGCSARRSRVDGRELWIVEKSQDCSPAGFFGKVHFLNWNSCLVPISFPVYAGGSETCVMKGCCEACMATADF